MRTLLLVLLALPVAAQSIPGRLDEYLAARTRLGQFSGAVLVASEGKVLLRKGYGYASLDHLVPVTPDTKFEIASLTKAFTAFAIHDLARQQKLRLDAPFCNYFDGCPDAWKPITVTQLIHHVSGIPDYEEDLDMGTEKYFAALTRDDSAKTNIDWARAKPLDFAPGTQFKYSNTAYLILGLIIEKVSGKTYEEYLRERVFTPLQMTSTMHIDRTRVQRNRATPYSHQAPLYDLVGGIDLTTSTQLRPVPLLRQTPPQADGGLLSTIDDLHKWTRAILGDGPLDAAFVHELLTPNQPGDYASGWFINKRFDRDRITHNGILPGMVSEIDLYPQSKTIVILLSNLDRIRLSNIVRDLTSIVFGKPYDVARSHKITPIDAAHAAPYLGTYKLADDRIMEITFDDKNGWLTATVKDQFVAGLLPESDTLYYAPMWEGTLKFVDGALIMRQSGKDIRGERLAKP
jgi:CubicO group peptidase (beta-lactamase class C family)